MTKTTMKTDLTRFMQHLPTCNIMQDWKEAEQAMADTPHKFRDREWEMAVDDLNMKMQQCTCGLTEAKEMNEKYKKFYNDVMDENFLVELKNLILQYPNEPVMNLFEMCLK